MTTVVDTNVVAALMLPTAANAEVAELLRQDPDWRLPPLWRSEFRQVLLKYVRRRIRRTGTAAELQAADV